MISNMNLLLIVGIVAIFAQTAYSHSCYSCNTLTAKDHCADPFVVDGMEKKDCSKVAINSISGIVAAVKNSTGCMKGVSESKGVKTYIRDCYFGDVSDKKNCESFITGVKQMFGDDKIMDCNVCVGELCNGSNEVTATMSLGAFLAILLVRNLF